MDNFKSIYRILSILESYLDKDSVYDLAIEPHNLGITMERRNHYLEMLSDLGYVSGIVIVNRLYEGKHIEVNDIQITLKGLEYLHFNPIMQKIRDHEPVADIWNYL